MKRNFLLMLLLTLLPLAGLAQSLSFTSATYDGSSHSLPTATIGGNTIPVSTSSYVTYNSYRYRINHWTYKSSNVSQYEDAGTYIANVQRRSDGMFGSWADYTTLTLTVNKGTNTVSPDPTISGWKYGTTPVSPSGSAAKWGFVEYQYSANGTDGWGDYATVVNGESGDYYVSAYVAVPITIMKYDQLPYHSLFLLLKLLLRYSVLTKYGILLGQILQLLISMQMLFCVR